MTRRWSIWTLGIALMAALLLLPLRAALNEADLAQLRLTARQVAGSIWHGRIGDLTLDRQLIGTFDVRLNPAALLLGRVDMRFERIGSLSGPLTGGLRTGGQLRGVEDLTGQLPVAATFAPLPVESVDFENATILFRNGVCSEAKGRLTARLGLQLGPTEPSRGLSGSLRCDGERVRAKLISPSGSEQVEFYIASSGRLRGWITIRNAAPEIAAGLALYGFQPGPGGLTLSVDGRL